MRTSSNLRGFGLCAVLALWWVSALPTINPAQSAIGVRLHTWQIPTPNSLPSGLAIDPAVGKVYVAQFDGGKIAELDPATDVITEWAVGSGPNHLIWNLGDVYFSESTGDRLARLSPSFGTYSSEALPTLGSFPQGLAMASVTPDQIWFSELMGNRVGRLSLTGFVFDALLPTFPMHQTVAPQESGVSATSTFVSPRVTPGNLGLAPAAVFTPTINNGPFNEWSLANAYFGPSMPETVAVDVNGHLWIANSVQNVLAKLDPGSDTLLLFDLPGDSVAVDLALDDTNHVWFTEGYAHRIGRLDVLTQEVVEWATPTIGQPLSLTLDADGRVWFTEREGERIGVLDPVTNIITEYQLPPDTHPLELALDPAGNVWFSAERGNYIGRISFQALGEPPSPPANAITGLELAQDAQLTAQATVSYAYSGNHGLPAFVQVLPSNGGAVNLSFSSEPGTIPGIGTGTTVAAMQYQSIGCITTDGVEVWMYDNTGSVFLIQHYDASLSWDCNS